MCQQSAVARDASGLDRRLSDPDAECAATRKATRPAGFPVDAECCGVVAMVNWATGPALMPATVRAVAWERLEFLRSRVEDPVSLA